MMETLFGIPLWLLGVGCLAIAYAYYHFWPQPNAGRVTPRTPFQHFMLRYGHALVWVLLAAGCFLAGFGYFTVGGFVAALALPLYLAFLVVLLQDRSRDQAEQAARRQAARTRASNAPE